MVVVEETDRGRGEIVDGVEIAPAGAVVSGGHAGGGSGGFAKPGAVHAERRSDAAAIARTTEPIPEVGVGKGSTEATSRVGGTQRSVPT